MFQEEFFRKKKKSMILQSLTNIMELEHWDVLGFLLSNGKIIKNKLKIVFFKLYHQFR